MKNFITEFASSIDLKEKWTELISSPAALDGLEFSLDVLSVGEQVAIAIILFGKSKVIT